MAKCKKIMPLLSLDLCRIRCTVACLICGQSLVFYHHGLTSLEVRMETSTNNEPLKLVLADTFVLYMKTYAVHWNYKGAKFFSVHKLTEEHYQELAEAIDNIAERIRAKGEEAPISLSNILGSSDLSEMKNQSASDDSALRELVAGHTLLAKRANQAVKALEQAEDYFSMDMMVDRIGAHEKAVWMLRSFLSGEDAPQPARPAMSNAQASDPREHGLS
jgi:starvation-inducible DNA-binding protein